MTLADYYRAVAEAGEAITAAEGRLRQTSREAPTVQSREETLSAADSLSSTKRRLRVVVAEGEAERPTESVAPLRLVSDPVQIGPLAINPTMRRVTVNGAIAQLTSKEYSLLRVLAAEPSRVFTKEELLRDVWGFRSLSRTRTLDSHASRLRRKLCVGDARFVVNCWGVGYRLIDEIPASVAA